MFLISAYPLFLTSFARRIGKVTSDHARRKLVSERETRETTDGYRLVNKIIILSSVITVSAF